MGCCARCILTSIESLMVEDNFFQNCELPNSLMDTEEVNGLDSQLSNSMETISEITELHSEEPARNKTAMIKTLRAELQSANRKIATLEKQLSTLQEKFQKVFNNDQVNFLKVGSSRGMTWSDETINKSLKLYMTCGTKGYEEVRNQRLPYPSIRTVQSRIQEMQFKPEILQDVFNILEKN